MNDQRTLNAQKRADKISDATDTKAMNLLAKAALNESNPQVKIFWLHRTADELGKAAKGNVACDKGCSHCCHQPVMMSLTEAKYIARYTGIELTIPDVFNFSPAMQYSGVACPLLENGKCSVYAFRPFACRVYYSLDDDEEACKIVPGKTIEVPYLDNRQHHAFELSALRELALENGDIRDFFKVNL